MKVTVIGVTRTGNLGGTAMLCAVEETLKSSVSEIVLASILPAVDQLQKGPDNTRITNADFRILICCLLPFCLLLWPLRNIGLVQGLLVRMPFARELKNADALVDLSGVAFVDGRGVSLLIYNVSVVLPALFLGVPVYKLSQALGPFETSLNRFVARWILGRCRLVAARGQATYDNLKSLGLDNIEMRHDTSFALSLPAAVHEAANRELAKSALAQNPNEALVLMSLSQVVRNHCRDIGLDFVGELESMILELSSKGFQVGLLPHSSDTGIRKNNDWQLAQEISDRLRRKQVTVPIVNPNGDPRLARAIIGHAQVFVACRFHSLIAALSQSVPVLTLGWSHKYLEAARPFGMGGYTLDYTALSAAKMVELVLELMRKREVLRSQMREQSEKAKADAQQGILKVINEN